MQNEKRVFLRQASAKWAALLAFLFLIGSAWVAFDALFSPRPQKAISVEIPDFCGKREEELIFADWMRVETDYRYDAGTEAGVVLAQEPSAGNRRKLSASSPTCELRLVVSLGEESAELPNLIGQDAKSAEALLRGLGFVVETEQSFGAYPEGCVFETQPRGGEKLPVGSRVRLFVSAGTPQKTVEVPNLCGLSRADALLRLWLCELGVKEVREVASDQPAGCVVDQSHRPGTLVAAGSEITLYVSRRWNEEGEE